MKRESAEQWNATHPKGTLVSVSLRSGDNIGTDGYARLALEAIERLTLRGVSVPCTGRQRAESPVRIFLELIN